MFQDDIRQLLLLAGGTRWWQRWLPGWITRWFLGSEECDALARLLMAREQAAEELRRLGEELEQAQAALRLAKDSCRREALERSAHQKSFKMFLHKLAHLRAEFCEDPESAIISAEIDRLTQSRLRPTTEMAKALAPAAKASKAPSSNGRSAPKAAS